MELIAELRAQRRMFAEQLAAERAILLAEFGTQRKSMTHQLMAPRTDVMADVHAQRQRVSEHGALTHRLCAPVIEDCSVGLHTVELKWSAPPRGAKRFVIELTCSDASNVAE